MREPQVAQVYTARWKPVLSDSRRIQEPYNSQNYNRYAYGLNNPLIYSDKSGKIFWLIPVLIGAAINVVTNGIENSINNRPFFQGAWKAGITGAVTGAISFGIGNVAQGITNTLGRIAFQTVAHGYLGGFSSVANGGGFFSGMASGALGSLAATGTGTLLKGASIGWEAVGTVASGSLMGGIGAEISGGNFWDGARNGLISAGLNHATHMLMEGDGQPKPREKGGYKTPPKELPGFPDAERMKPKGGRPRWRLPDGDIIEWDGQHGEVERYNPRGKHKGAWTPDGQPKKPTVPGRRITPYASNGFVQHISTVTGLTGSGLAIYLILSEGSRLFPPRNLIPIP